VAVPANPNLNITMIPRISALTAYAGLAFLGSIAHAGLTNPGSLVIYPVYDNRLHEGGTRNVTLFTITNTHPSETVRVHFKYVDGETCLITNKFRTLTPNDTFSAITSFDNPNSNQGYCFVYAVNSGTTPINFNYLTASQVDLRGEAEDVDDANFEFEPFVFRTPTRRVPHGQSTDLDCDGLRDFNGEEYEKLPELLHFPRFFGQAESQGETVPRFKSDLVLINMTGGRAFTATVDFAVYNDNEEPLSAQYSFDCWSRVPLSGPYGINDIFTNDFLLNSTSHNVNEVFGAQASFPETGWFTVDGAVASSNIDILNPAILGVLIENDRGQNRCGGVVTPFGSFETQDNGDLLPIALGGDTDNIACP